MVLLTFGRILLSSVRDAFYNFKQEAVTRDRLIALEPSLRKTLGRGVSIDAATIIGAHSVVGDNTRLLNAKLAHHVQIGKDSGIAFATLEPYSRIGSNVRLDFSTVGSYTYMAGMSIALNVTIGRFCSIAEGLAVGMGAHPTNMVSTSPVFFSPYKQCGVTFAPEGSNFDEQPKTVIGNDVWLGANVFVRDGVTIGSGAIVAAGSVVVKDIAPYAIVGGVPAREIRKRFSDVDITTLLALKWWDWPEEVLREASPLFQAGDVGALLRWHQQYTGKVPVLNN
jgi:acetyltransferase-like isoleucine patch superfamily enzyme